VVGFPSPCGEKVGINPVSVRSIDYPEYHGFRPLAGKR